MKDGISSKVDCRWWCKIVLRWPSAVTLFLGIVVFILPTCIVLAEENFIDLSNPQLRHQQVEKLVAQSRRQKEYAWSVAGQHGWPAKEKVGNVMFELMAIDGERLRVYRTTNVNAAVSIAADLVRNTPPYDANGTGLVAGIWDGGSVRATHQEFGGRVTLMDSASAMDHSTHVAGTIAAAGVNASALGMAPSLLLDSYDWTDDISEMTSRAMSYANEPETIQISNHSYGYAAGWEYSFSPPRWYGTWGNRESDIFGMYDSATVQWDQLCYNAPYFLPFYSAGNNRSDNAPAAGATFEYFKFPRWRTKTYDPATDPYGDNWDNGGFDTIATVATAKNVVTVGALNDAVTAGVRDLTKATMTSFSCWGPTDDGRIKPDIVANGVGLYSSIASSDSSYASYSGTSMSSPSAAGAAMLLVDYFGRLFPGQAMRGSTIKALLLHSADDLGQAGPDYKFGFGLLNILAAAQQIKSHYDFPDANMIVEAEVNSVDAVRNYNFRWDDSSSIRATLCWTDPPASALNSLDNPSPRLINDLDLRIIDPNGSVFYPYVLNPSSPSDAATTGDNVRDNIEQVYIALPSIGGVYTVRISYKGTLTNGQQHYSLILSGQKTCLPLITDFNGDCIIDYEDLSVLVSAWLQDEPLVDIAPEGGDGIIDMFDYARFAQGWQ